MKVALRFVVVLIAVAVFLTAWLVLWFCMSGRFRALLQSGALGAVTVAGWLLCLIVGPYAAIQLWRFRRGGLYASVAIVTFAALYYLGGIFLLRSSNAPLTPIVISGLSNAVLLSLLLSPAARRLCRPKGGPTTS
jgi:hypothetical protein